MPEGTQLRRGLEGMAQQRVWVQLVPDDSFLLQTPSLASLYPAPQFCAPPLSPRDCASLSSPFPSPAAHPQLCPATLPEVGRGPAQLQLPMSRPKASGHGRDIEGTCPGQALFQACCPRAANVMLTTAVSWAML